MFTLAMKESENTNYENKNTPFLSVLVLSFHGLNAQINVYSCGYQGYQSIEKDKPAEGSGNSDSVCQMYGASASSQSYEEAVAQIEAILDKVGLFRNFEVEECGGINNAIAVTIAQESGDMDRYIIYDNDFFERVSMQTNTDWGLISILAHEVGHHLNGHTLKSGGSNHKIELQADEFSGFVLARMGCSLNDAQAAISKMLPDKASSTHPAKADRLAAIEKGWGRGNGKTITVKEIDEDINIKVIENVIEDEEIKNLITAEQVLARYIDAIGGQENITKIKTMEQITRAENAYGSSRSKTTYMSPTKMLMEMGAASFLKLGNKLYGKKNDKWELSPGSFKNPLLSEASYIFELAALVNNIDIEFVGTETEQGNTYYVLRLPLEEYSEGSEFHSMNIITTPYNYYNAETGLLDIQKTISNAKMIYKDASIEDRETTTERTTFLSDYKEVSGVLFPHHNRVGQLETKIEYKINPVINPADFEVGH